MIKDCCDNLKKTWEMETYTYVSTPRSILYVDIEGWKTQCHVDVTSSQINTEIECNHKQNSG